MQVNSKSVLLNEWSALQVGLDADLPLVYSATPGLLCSTLKLLFPGSNPLQA